MYHRVSERRFEPLWNHFALDVVICIIFLTAVTEHLTEIVSERLVWANGARRDTVLWWWDGEVVGVGVF